MTVLFVLVPLAVLFSTLALIAFAWAARRGQFDDLVTPAVRVLHDGEREPDAKARAREPSRFLNAGQAVED